MPDILVFDVENAIMTIKEWHVGIRALFFFCEKSESFGEMD